MRRSPTATSTGLLERPPRVLAVTRYVPTGSSRRPTLPVKRTWFAPRSPRTVNRPATWQDGAGPRTTKTTRPGRLRVKVILAARFRPVTLTLRARMPVTRGRRERAAGRGPRWYVEATEPCPPAELVELGEPESPEPDGEPDGLDELCDPGDGGAGAAGGGIGAGGVGRGRGGIGTLTVGSGGGGGTGGTGGGGSACVVVGSGRESVGTETVGSPTWPSACAVSTPARPPASASAAAASAVFSLFATVPCQ
jgi:hypothetical protein